MKQIKPKVPLPSEGGNPNYFKPTNPAPKKAANSNAERKTYQDKINQQENYVRGTHSKFKADADRYVREARTRDEVLKIERGTEYEKENHKKAEANLEGLFGPGWRNAG